MAQPSEGGSPRNDKSPRAQIIGTGLIGGSIGLALRRKGWTVTGRDLDPERAARAVSLGALDAVGDDPEAQVTFVATPAGAVVGEARRVLDAGIGLVTDVAGIKEPITTALGQYPAFVGGHPMAGSEQEGVEGADAYLFDGATWVLTPTEHTDPDAYARLQTVVSSLGADVVAVPPRRHDELVAMVSHVPHLTAATLMNLAADAGAGDATLLRLAAGGFRDMTRIAAGHPGIWPDVVAQNCSQIVQILDQLMAALGEVRRIVADGRQGELLEMLERARVARVNLPTGAPPVEEIAEIRVPIPDRPGALRDVTTLLAEIGVNVFNVETVHSIEGDKGVLVLSVDETNTEVATKFLSERGFHPSVRRLG
jgi:prephenate dehydrogenase